MHSVLWASILASAGVALMTTLLVEYLAKPALEARKDRILEKSRDRRKALKDIQRAVSIMISLKSSMDTIPDRVSMEYLKKATEQFTERLLSAYDTLSPPESVLDQWAYVPAVADTFALAVQVGWPPEEAWRALDSLIDELDAFTHYFKAPKWRVRYRRMIVKDIESYSHYEGTEGPDQLEAPLENDGNAHQM